MEWKEIQEKLGQPTPKDKIKQRKGFNDKMLSYVDARYVMDVLDEVVGSANWKDEYQVLNGNMFCTLYIRSGEEWVGKTDVGAESNIEKEKGEVSGAFKRAAVKWGVARDLYNEEPISAPKSSYKKWESDVDADCISFGKHRGKSWSVIPIDYLEWLNNSDATKPDTKALVQDELERRASNNQDVNGQQEEELPIPF